MNRWATGWRRSSSSSPPPSLPPWTGEQALPDPDFPHGQMYILGEYCHDLLGRYIVLYYGSFAALFPDGDEETWKDEIFATVAHEFTHHMEDAAGLHALDDQDMEFLNQARRDLL